MLYDESGSTGLLRPRVQHHDMMAGILPCEKVVFQPLDGSNRFATKQRGDSVAARGETGGSSRCQSRDRCKSCPFRSGSGTGPQEPNISDQLHMGSRTPMTPLPKSLRLFESSCSGL